MSGTGVVNGTKPNSGIYGEAASIGKKIWNSRIGDCEGVKRILNWHTEGARTKRQMRAWYPEWIGNNRRRCEGRIEKCADILKVSKHREVLVTQIEREGTVEGLAIRPRRLASESRAG